MTKVVEAEMTKIEARIEARIEAKIEAKNEAKLKELREDMLRREVALNERATILEEALATLQADAAIRNAKHDDLESFVLGGVCIHLNLYL